MRVSVFEIFLVKLDTPSVSINQSNICLGSSATSVIFSRTITCGFRCALLKDRLQ